MRTNFPLDTLHQLHTPLFYYDMDLLKKNLSSAKQAAELFGYHIHYALKANANYRILETIAQMGFGADCVSGEEISAAIQAGFSGADIAFAGVGKSDEEILTALHTDIFSFNVESPQELLVIEALAKQENKSARIALRINPNVDAKTHHYITTGIEENKFGINFWDLEKVLDMLQNSQHLQFTGLHFHIGSQITDLDVFKGLCIRVNEIQQWFRERKIVPGHLNLGGGLGINYHQPDDLPDFKQFFGLIHDTLEVFPGQTVHFELGRALVAQSGTLIARVLYVKEGIQTKFAILDAGMTELIRPALYQAYHKIDNLTSIGGHGKYDVVGPICESSDCFGKAVDLPDTKRGDLLAIRSAGAYGEVMRSQYNLRKHAKAYYSDLL